MPYDFDFHEPTMKIKIIFDLVDKKQEKCQYPSSKAPAPTVLDDSSSPQDTSLNLRDSPFFRLRIWLVGCMIKILLHFEKLYQFYKKLKLHPKTRGCKRHAGLPIKERNKIRNHAVYNNRLSQIKDWLGYALWYQ